jgi:hypothetical protein
MICKFNIAVHQSGNLKFSCNKLPELAKPQISELRGRSQDFVVFASGKPVASGIVGFANIVFFDSPPLTGWAFRAALSFVEIGSFGVTSVTQFKNTANQLILRSA